MIILKKNLLSAASKIMVTLLLHDHVTLTNLHIESTVFREESIVHTYSGGGNVITAWSCKFDKLPYLQL